MIITRTPYRISLFGGGSDHPAWFRENRGEVVSFSIDKYCYLNTRILPPFFSHKYRVSYSIVELCNSLNEIKHPVVREVIRKFAPTLQLEVHHHGDLPARSGIGSSSAFTVGLIHALLELQSQKHNKVELADLAIQMEHEILKENVGWQDQVACSIGGFNHLVFSKDNSWTSKRIDVSHSYLSKLEQRLFLVYTGLSRSSSDITLGLLKDLSQKKSQMLRVVEMVSTSLEILNSESDLDIIGELLHESWLLKRSLNAFSSNSELDDIYDQALRAGALGGKILGAGGGGFFLFWLREDSIEDFRSKFRLGTHVPVKVSFEGSQIVHNSALRKGGY
jgi:D-glycero-alpha-D-manno-heptose-7-phosphate kinase